MVALLGEDVPLAAGGAGNLAGVEENGYLICGGESGLSAEIARAGVVRINMMRNIRLFLCIGILFLLFGFFIKDRYDLKFSVIDYVFYVK